MTECLFRAGFLVRRAGLLDSCAKLLNVSVDGIDKAGCGVGVDEGFCGCLCVDARDGSGCDIGGTADEEGDGEEEEEDAVFFLLEMDLKLASTCCFRDRLLAGADEEEEAAAACFAAGSALLCLEGWCNDMLHSSECGSLVDARSRGAEEPRRACLIQCGRAGRLCFTRERAPGVAAGVLVFSRRAGSARAGEKEGAGRRGERERGRAVGETRTDMLTCLGVLWTGRTAARAGGRRPPPGRQSQQEASRETTDRTTGPRSEAKRNTAQHSTAHDTSKMKIYYIGVVKPAAKDGASDGANKTTCLCEEKDLSSFSFFQRSSVGQFMTFFAQTIAERTQPDQRQSIEEGEYVGHVYVRPEGVAGVLITDKAYPIRPAFTLLNKLCEDYLAQHSLAEIARAAAAVQANPGAPPPGDAELAGLLSRYQNPHEADALMKVQQELDETKIVLQQSIENVLQRGEKLDALVDKSEALTSSSKTFYKQAKKTNSCCVLM